MILYPNRLWGIPSLKRLYGSAIPRGFIFSCLGTLLAIILQFTIPQQTLKDWFLGHPYPFSVFSFGIGFILVFRNNFAYQRYWEGRTQLQTMDARFVDAITQAIYYDKGTLPVDVSEEGVMKARRFGETLVHLMSLLHALCLQNLRRDWNLNNLNEHNTLKCQPSNSVKYHRKVKRKEFKKNIQSQGSFWNFLIESFRVGWKYFPTDALHVRVNNFERECYNHSFPLSVIGGITEHEKLILNESDVQRSDSSWELSKGLNDMNGVRQPGAGERIHVVADWIQGLCIKRRREGGLAVAPPIVTRIFHMMSEGLAGFENCRKIADTPFPFAMAQVSTVVLLMFSISLAVANNAFIYTSFLLIIMNFITLLVHFSLNEVALDLEDPFVFDPNDLPILETHYAFNERLLAIACTNRPIGPAEAGNSAINRQVVDDPINETIIGKPDTSQLWDITSNKLNDYKYMNLINKVGGPIEVTNLKN